MVMDDFIFHWNYQHASITNFRWGKFIHTIIDKRFPEKSVNVVMWVIYGFTFALFGLNIALSYLKSGWFTI